MRAIASFITDNWRPIILTAAYLGLALIAVVSIGDHPACPVYVAFP